MTSVPVKTLQSYANTLDTAQPRKVWWLIGVLLLGICIFVQMPAAWLIQKFMPNSPYFEQVSGNVWQGSAIVRLPTPMDTSGANAALSANVNWSWRPLGLLTGKLSADVEMNANQTHLDGVINRGFNSWQLKDLSGKIDKQTLANMVQWQLPDAPIQVNMLSLAFIEDKGFDDVDGQLTWVGGELGYPSGNQVYNINLPVMRADISQETKNDSQVIHANLVDNNSKRLGDLYLDAQGMLDVSLTQRLLQNMPDYHGNAPADTAVVSVRQPLFGGMNGGSGTNDDISVNTPTSIPSTSVSSNEEGNN